jgi:Secretion system C-terminal sorting domain
MKKILLSLLLIVSVNLIFAQVQLPCVSSYKINNGGGSCPDTILNGTTVTATGSITLSFAGTVDPSHLPIITGVIDITDPFNPLPVSGITFGPGTLNNNGTVTYCYYVGPNNSNNLLGHNDKFRFIIAYDINGQLVPCVSNIPLPVNFKSFTAVRNHSTVALKWETSTEQNSNGFAIERNIRGTWEQVAFVPSQAANGYSEILLSYQYNDPNNIKGISQYRLRQVDFDAKSKYSEIRAVRGEGQSGQTIVFPNPSADGRVSVVFEDATITRDATLSDMTGHILKQWKGITNNNIQIDNLTPGMYSLKIVATETGEQSVQKIIVSKH